MTRAELSDDGTTWNIPGARTKNKRPHVVPLAPLAREMVGSGSEGFVFTTTGRSPFSGWSKIKRRLDEAMAIRHGDCTTCAAPPRPAWPRSGSRPHIVEAALNHFRRQGRRRRHVQSCCLCGREARGIGAVGVTRAGARFRAASQCRQDAQGNGRDVSGRHRSTSERRLTPNQIVDAQ